MAIDGVSAIGAVGKSLELSPTGGAGAAKTVGETGFVDAIGKAFTDAIGSVQAGEAAAIQGLQGGVPAYKVVDAVMGAQRSLQQMLAVRDKAVAAYQEVSRMQI